MERTSPPAPPPPPSDNHELPLLAAEETETAQPPGSRPEVKCGRPQSPAQTMMPQNNQRPVAAAGQLGGVQAAQKASTSPAPDDSVRRVCYFLMEPKTGISLDQVDGSLCTHLILAFARISSEAKLVVVRESDHAHLEQVSQFKRKFPSVRVMISVCNDCHANGFPMLAQANNELRYKFAKSAVEFLQRFHLDGVDLHWEFPNFSSSLFGLRGEYERLGLTKILKSLRSAIVENFFDRQQCEQQQELSRRSSSRSGGAGDYSTSSASSARATAQVEPHLLTVAVGGQEAILKSSYEFKQLANLCDWLNVMSYDYFLFKPYLPFTGPNSPLHPIVEHYPILNKLALSWTVQRLLEEGLEPDKLVAGIPCYARAYRLVFRQTSPVPFTLAIGARGGQLEDQLNYREVIDLLARPDTVVEFDARARVPYLLADSGYTWISYESPQSVREKVRYILDKQLGGYMTWNLNSDDFTGAGQPKVADGGLATQIDGQQNGFTAGPGQVRGTFPLHRAMLDEVLSCRPSR